MSYVPTINLRIARVSDDSIIPFLYASAFFFPCSERDELFTRYLLSNTASAIVTSPSTLTSPYAVSSSTVEASVEEASVLSSLYSVTSVLVGSVGVSVGSTSPVDSVGFTSSVVSVGLTVGFSVVSSELGSVGFSPEPILP